MRVTNNIYQKQIKYHVFNVVTNSELTKLVPVFTIRPAFPTSVKNVNTSFKNVWRTWGPAFTDVIGGPHDFLSPGFDEFQKLCGHAEIAKLKMFFGGGGGGILDSIDNLHSEEYF